MKINDLSADILNEAYISGWGQVKTSAQIRAFIIESMLEWYKDNGTDWSFGLIPEILANYMEAIGATGNESPAMAKVLKVAVKQIMEQYREVVDEGYIDERADQLIKHAERLKKLNVYPDLLTALQKSVAASLKAEMDRWGDDDELDESEVWDQPNPKSKSKPLTASQKAAAKRRAKAAGRKYPNLIDNMWASKR